MNQRYRFALTAVALATAVGAHAVQFTVTITNLGPQPLAPVFFATHNATFDLWDHGSAASAAVRLMAEEGDTSLLEAQATAAGAAVMSSGTTAGGPFGPGASRTFTIDAEMSHPWFSFASMLAATNDGFIGSTLGFGDAQINLFQGGQPLVADFTVSFLDVWDAGTEVNDELMTHIPAFGGSNAGVPEGGVITRPHEGIVGRGDVPTMYDWYGFDVAHVSIVPEPATMSVLAVGGVLLALRRRRR